MKNLNSHALQVHNNKLSILDQQKLPYEEVWIDCQSPEHMVEMIQTLKVRGAPLIGIAAAMSLAQYAEAGADFYQIKEAAQKLREARPTAVNLTHCIDRQLTSLNKSGNICSVITVAEELFYEDVRLCQNIAKHGHVLLKDGDNILTHCNTGCLVTTGEGTALGVIAHAHKQNKKVHVYVDETRPLLQGARLTTWELSRKSIPYTLVCDNMAATLMRQQRIQKVIVGADRIARNGDFANKIGTYSLAILCHYHRIPFYVAAPYTTIDQKCFEGKDIIVEERSPDEVRGLINESTKIVWSMLNSPVFNPAFDVTPADLVTAYILDCGIFKPNEIKNLENQYVTDKMY